MNLNPFAWIKRNSVVIGVFLLNGLLCPSVAQTPMVWSGADIGSVGAAGSANESNGVITLTGSGADIGGTTDAGYFRYTSWNGDGTFIARVTSLTSVDNWAKLGIMVRADLSAGAPHVFACVNPARIAAYTTRTTAGAAGTLHAMLEDKYRAMPMWLKLTRDGDEFALYFSADGTTWLALGPRLSVPMPATALVDLAITSKADGRLANATVDNFKMSSVLPGELAVVARGASRVELRWFDHAIRETGFEIERSADGVSFARVATAPANPEVQSPLVGFFDATASAETKYWYRVRAIGPNGFSGYSNVASVTTPPVPPAGWIVRDIGDTAAGGSLIESGGTLRMTGSGTGVGSITLPNSYMGPRGIFEFTEAGGADEFYFATRHWVGDGEIVARIASITGPQSAQAGIMIRAGDDPSAASVFNFLSVDGKGGVLVRAAERSMGVIRRLSEMPFAHATGVSAPLWVKLVRLQGGVMSYWSRDGVDWMEAAWSKAVLPADVHFGLGVASGVDGTLATGMFEQVSIGAVRTSIAPPAPTNLKLSATTFGSVSLGWTNSSIQIDAVEVERSADGVTFASAGKAWNMFVDQELNAGTTYYYRVRAARGGFFSGYSNILAATTKPLPSPPMEVSAVALAPDLVDVSWRPIDGANGYTVERSTDNIVFSPLGTGWDGYRDRTAQPKTRYFYRLIAMTDGGSSAPSAAVEVTTPEFTPTGEVPLGTQPLSRAVHTGGSVILLAPPASTAASYRWLRDGNQDQYVNTNELRAYGHSTNAGLYSVVVTEAGQSVTSWPAIVGILSNQKTNEYGSEVGTDIRHPNGNIYDQVLAMGYGPTITANPGQVTRISFLDHSQDIVQVEFSGAGTLTLTLAGASPGQTAIAYNQPEIKYTLGHARIIIAGADETTNVTVFTVGRRTAVNQALFRPEMNYDGFADIAYIAILSTNGKFGGVRAGNAQFWADAGVTGIYAPGVTFTGPLYVGDVSAQDAATPVFAVGGVTDVQITGGEMRQMNGQPVQVDFPMRLRFEAGEDSHGRPVTKKTNQARFERAGEDVTAQVAPP